VANAAARAGVSIGTRDSFTNFAAKVGIGTENLSSGSTYGFNPISRNRQLLEWMYRGSWIVGRVVDAVAEDMTRAGTDIVGISDPDQIEMIKKGMSRLRIDASIADIVRWARLYGGAIGVHLVDGQDVSTPLRIDTVGKGKYRGLLVLDRWMVTPSLDDLVTDLGPDLGYPKFYTVTTGAPALSNQRIHHSRVIRLEGDPLPHWQRIAENGWGMSVVERLYDRLTAFDSTTQGTAQLVYRAHLRVIQIENLRDILAAGGPAEEALVKQMQMIRLYQSNEGVTLLDAKDQFNAHNYTFSGLSDVMTQFAQQVAGATKIPLVRLLGQSPGGLNATGESDIRNYYDDIDQQREYKLRTGFDTLAGLLYRSEIGGEPPNGYGFDFNPLWQMSDKERAEIAVSITSAVSQAESDGIVSKATALKELRQSADVTGVWSNISSEEVEAAESEPPPPPEDLADPITGGLPGLVELPANTMQ
jgi:phage-related protein (TIGR01555 family)